MSQQAIDDAYEECDRYEQEDWQSLREKGEAAKSTISRLESKMAEIFDIANEPGIGLMDMAKALGRIRGIAELHGIWMRTQR